ncbi:unnamed protein product, partial [Timema podura]|nr:unnamed protein product [Timema podura]
MVHYADHMTTSLRKCWYYLRNIRRLLEHCTLPPDKGVCRSFVHKWFYDTAAKKCFTFIYGGCPGNDNRFDSQADCLLSCAQGN